MAYTTATVVTYKLGGDGCAHLIVEYTGNAGEPSVREPLSILQSTAPDPNYIRGQAMARLAALNESLTVIAAITVPQILDTATPLPAAPASTFGCYRAATAGFTPGATPQDVFTIRGSATKTITVWAAGISTTQTTVGANIWHLVRRSTANSAGTSAAVTSVPSNSAFPAATTQVLQYTANPTAGTLVGRIWAGRVSSPVAATAINAEHRIEFSARCPQVLTGTGQILAWNFNGVALPAGLSVMAWFEWTEQ